MADWLIVRLARDDDQPITWAVVDAHGQLTHAPATGSTESLLAAAGGRRVALLVPGEDVLQLCPDVPLGSEARLLQILPYALEDQLAEEVESLHFAVAARARGGAATSVDIVARRLMDEWLAQARELGFTPNAVHADSELVPVVPGHITALIEGASITVRSEARRPAVLPVDDPALALDMALGSDAADLSAQHLIVYANSVDWQRHSAAVETLRPRLASLKVQLISGGVLALLAQQVPTAQAINLLQGSYAPAQNSGPNWRRWRLVAGLAMALLGLHILGKGLELQRLRSADKAVSASIDGVFREAMPGEPPSTDARRRMEQRLMLLRGAAAENGSLLGLLSAVATAHGVAPGTSIEALSFRKGAIDMKVAAPDAATLERMNESLRAGGLKSELTAGSSRGKMYEGRVQLQGTGS